MEKAYDLKALGERLKSKGLVQLENEAQDIVKETFAWLKESAAISVNPFDDVAATLYPMIETKIEEQVDKIDGVIGS